MTGYQEILTDPSYAGQIVTFTFPHIGNVGTNDEDIETVNVAAASGVRGVRRSQRAGHRARPTGARRGHLDAWLKARGIVGLAGVDTRALTALIRENGMPNAVIAHDPDGEFDLDGAASARPRPARPSTAWTSCREVTAGAALRLGRDDLGLGRGLRPREATPGTTSSPSTTASSATSCASSPARAARSRSCRRPRRAEEILALKPDGVFLSNGPGDPAATGEYAVPVIRDAARSARCRSSASASATRCSAWRSAARTDEDAPGPPRREPPGARTSPPARSRSSR